MTELGSVAEGLEEGEGAVGVGVGDAEELGGLVFKVAQGFEAGVVVVEVKEASAEEVMEFGGGVLGFEEEVEYFAEVAGEEGLWVGLGKGSVPSENVDFAEGVEARGGATGG